MKPSNYLLALIIVILTLSTSQGYTMNILKNEPVFTIQLNTFGIKYILKINGVTLLTESSSDGQLTTSIPVNHWMRSGKNTIEVQIRPPEKGVEYNPHSKLMIDLTVKNNKKLANIYSIANITLSGQSANIKQTDISSASGKLSSENIFTTDSKGDVEIYDITVEEIPKYSGGLIFKREVNVPSSLPLWAFYKSDNVPDLESMSDKDYYDAMDVLLNEYLKVQTAIQNNAIENIIPLFTERNKETDAAYYLKAGQTENGIKESLTQAATDTNLELLPLNRDLVDFTIESNRKLARLSRKGLNPAIALNFKNGAGSQRYQIYFRYEDGKWILTR